MPPDERSAQGSEAEAARELLACYLKAVAFWLPRREKRDILAELEGEIRAQVAEQERELGRALGEGEMEALLERWGHPPRVAERYQPRSRALIGPSVFPIYRAVLKGVLWFYFVPWLLVWAYLVTLVPSYRAEHPGFALIETLGAWIDIVITSFALITAAFALLELNPRALERLEAWKPRDVHPPPDPNRITASASLGELVGGVSFVVAWVSLPLAPISYAQEGTDVRWTLGPVWQEFHRGLFVPVLLLSLCAVGLAGSNLLRPRWTRLRRGLRAALRGTAALLVLFVLLEQRADVAAQLVSLKASAAQASGPSLAELLPAWTNLGVFIALAAACAWCLATCVWHAYRAASWRSDAHAAGTLSLLTTKADSR